MKTKYFLSRLLTICLLVSVPACNKNQSNDTADEAGVASKAEKADIKRLEKFLGIPVYPGAQLADIFTERRDDKIPEKKMDARIKLIIDEYEKVPQFYEKTLGRKFEVEIENDKKYYTLKFEKEGWEYEILVGHDTYMNKPMYEINMWLKIT